MQSTIQKGLLLIVSNSEANIPSHDGTKKKDLKDQSMLVKRRNTTMKERSLLVKLSLFFWEGGE